MAEHLLCKQGVVGSSPIISTNTLVFPAQSTYEPLAESGSQAFKGCIALGDTLTWPHG
jgi:hypothetical protein